MTSIKVKFRLSTTVSREGTVYYQVIQSREVRQLATDYHVFPSEWDGKRSMVTFSHKSDRKSLILSIRERIRWDVERLTKIVCKLDACGIPYTADDVIDAFKLYVSEYSLFNFMESIIAKLRQNGRIRTSETYRTTLNSFKKYRQGKDIMLDSLCSEVMEAYEAWHHHRGVTPNTVSFYMRILRAVYNRAVERAVIEDRHPFKHVYTGVDKTVKRALPLDVIRRIKKLDLSLSPALDFARDMFMISFYLRGMSFIDMVYLRKSNLKNGYVIYRRHKTRQQLTIEWTNEMQQILDKYPENETDYLLPIIKTPNTNERSVYRNTGYNINCRLKKIAQMVGVTIPLTLYVARHSWASAAQAKGIPLGVISEGMGHDSETTTQIYLAGLDTSAVDRANSLILGSLK